MDVYNFSHHAFKLRNIPCFIEESLGYLFILSFRLSSPLLYLVPGKITPNKNSKKLSRASIFPCHTALYRFKNVQHCSTCQRTEVLRRGISVDSCVGLRCELGMKKPLRLLTVDKTEDR